MFPGAVRGGGVSRRNDVIVGSSDDARFLLCSRRALFSIVHARRPVATRHGPRGAALRGTDDCIISPASTEGVSARCGADKKLAVLLAEIASR